MNPTKDFVYFGDKAGQSINFFHRKVTRIGDSESHYHLGLCYFFGLGVQKDAELAVKHFQIASEQGCPFAQNSLGTCYDRGVGVTQDRQRAKNCYQLSANQGFAPGQYNLANCCVAKDKQLAVKYYLLAAEQGHPSSEEALTRILNPGLIEQLTDFLTRIGKVDPCSDGSTL